MLTQGGEEKRKQGFVEEENHLKELGVDGRIILKRIFKKRDEGMHWIHLAQDRNIWRALVNAVMNIRFPQNAGNFLAS
jgi:hypothetical protein